MPVHPSAEELESLVEGVTILRHVKSGGQKAVYEARRAEEAIAFKIVEAGESAFGIPAGMERVERELRILAECECEQIVSLNDWSPRMIEIGEDQYFCYAEEWLEGEDLSSRFKKGALDPTEVKILLKDICEAIRKLSQAGYVHRDIKPENIMVVRDRFKLLDPGYALELEGPSLSVGVVGTWPYFAPEQFDFTKRRSFDFRIDQFALGIVAFQSLSLRHPWIETTSSPATYARMLEQGAKARSIKSHVPDIASAWDKVLSKTLELKPYDRFRSIELLQARIEDL